MGNPYLKTYNSGWQHYSNLLGEICQRSPQPPQEHKSSLEAAMAELRRAQAEYERSMVNLDNAQVGLPRFHTQIEMSPPPQEKMTNLEATMTEWRRVQVELAKSRT